VEFVGEGNDVRGIGPEREETACFARCARGNGLRFEDCDVVALRGVGGVPCEEVGGGAAYDSTSCVSSTWLAVGMRISDGEGVPMITMFRCGVSEAMVLRNLRATRVVDIDVMQRPAASY
jgi:hypothetical protein